VVTSRRKNSPSFPGFSRAINLLFRRLLRSKCNNDLHRGSLHINSSNTTGHHRTLTMSEIHEIVVILFTTQSTAVLHKHLNDELKLLCLLQFFPEVAQNSLRIPRVLHVQRNPRVLQVCGHHESTAKLKPTADWVAIIHISDLIKAKLRLRCVDEMCRYHLLGTLEFHDTSYGSWPGSGAMDVHCSGAVFNKLSPRATVRRYAPRRRQFESRRIYIRPRMSPHMAKLQAASVPIA